MIGRIPRLLACLLSCICLGGCAAAVIGGAAGGGYPVANGGRSVDAAANDARITSAINTRFVQDDLVNALDVNVDTHHGTVTLYGSMPSQEAVLRAVGIARSVKGVTRVVSRLAVVPK